MKTQRLLFALLGALCAARASGAVTVTTDLGQVVSQTQDPTTGAWSIIVRSTSSAAPTSFYILADANDDIAYVGVRANAVGQVTKLYIKGVNDAPRLRSVGLIERVEGTTRDVWLRELRTTGDVGSIKVTTIVDAQVGGNVTGDIELVYRHHGGESSMILMRVAGDVLGDIRTPWGSIFDLEVDGRIGLPGVENRTNIYVRNTIERLVAGDINSLISTVAYNPLGFAGHIETTKAKGGGGVLSGWFNTRTFYGGVNPGLFIAGALEANVVINESMNQPGSQIVLPAQGLSTQIVINASNAGGTWSQPIKIGPDSSPGQVVLSGPLYTAEPGMIGGGAVGHAPFRIHRPACDPPDREVARAAGSQLNGPVVVRHYGPVTWQQGDAPFIVEERGAKSQASWTLVTHRFEFALSVNERDITISPAPFNDGFLGGYEYRVRPVRTGPGALRCARVTGNPLVGHIDTANMGYDYIFTVESSCAGDLDGDGQVGSGDLATLLGSWGACPPGGAPCPADANGDATINSADLAVLLGAWGPCGK